MDSAVEQVQSAREQVQKAEEQRQIAEQQLGVSRSIRDAAAQSANIALRNFSVSRTSLRETARNTLRQLEALREGTSTNERSLEVLKQIESFQNDAKEAVKAQRTLAQNILETNKTRNIKLDNIKNSINEGVRELANRLSDVGRQFSTTDTVTTTGAARGTLTSGEISGLVSAAKKEKRLMPTGSKLMLANTSEVVLTRNQAKKIGLIPQPQQFAANGNAGIEGLSETANALNTAVGSLLTRLNDPGFVQQNINVSVDSERNINVKGLDAVESAVRDAFENRMARLPSKEEQGIASAVQSVISKLNELGIVNTQGF